VRCPCVVRAHSLGTRYWNTPLLAHRREYLPLLHFRLACCSHLHLLCSPWNSLPTLGRYLSPGPRNRPPAFLNTLTSGCSFASVPPAAQENSNPPAAPNSGFHSWSLPEGRGSAHLATCALRSVHILRALDRVRSRPNADLPPRRYHDASFLIHRFRLQVLRVALQAGHRRRARRRDDDRSRDHRPGQWCVTHPCVRDLILPWASNEQSHALQADQYSWEDLPRKGWS